MLSWFKETPAWFLTLTNLSHPFSDGTKWSPTTCTLLFVAQQWASTFRNITSLSSSNDMLLRSSLKAAISLLSLLLFVTLLGSCFAYDVIILHVNTRERVVVSCLMWWTVISGFQLPHTPHLPPPVHQDCRPCHLHFHPPLQLWTVCRPLQIYNGLKLLACSSHPNVRVCVFVCLCLHVSACYCLVSQVEFCAGLQPLNESSYSHD